jgi:hypothetical protein
VKDLEPQLSGLKGKEIRGWIIRNLAERIFNLNWNPEKRLVIILKPLKVELKEGYSPV